MKLILGSQSVGRKQVLKDAGYDFQVMNADIDEKAIRSENYQELPLLIARAKANKLLIQIQEDALLITSDQVSIFNGELREEPESLEEARKFLRSYSHSFSQTNTAVVVTNTKTKKSAEGIDIAKIYFKEIPDDIIEQLLKEGNVMRASGGFISEDPLLNPFVEKIEGTSDSIMGLPMELTKRLIKEVE